MSNVLNLISANFAIRSALGNVNMPNIASSIWPDLRRWSIEGMKFINKKAILRRGDTAKLIVNDNRAKMCDTFKMLECLKINGKVVPYVKGNRGCGSTCSSTCQNCISSCCDDSTQYEFYIKGCWIKFTNPVDDGTILEVEFWELETDEEGNILIMEEAVEAIAEYISFMVKRKFGDSSYGAHEKRWYFLCKQARAEINKKSQQDIEQMGYLWKPINYNV